MMSLLNTFAQNISLFPVIDESGVLKGTYVSFTVQGQWHPAAYMPFAHPSHILALAYPVTRIDSESAVTEYQAEQLTKEGVELANFS